ncbi:MAG: hypothetical protein M1836_005609 [Candelina mexicana]|nr:MAG: hypothetical protein M1836_005609 [Candelina mexicana]
MQLSLVCLYAFPLVSVAAIPLRNLLGGISGVIRTLPSLESESRTHTPNEAYRRLELNKPKGDFWTWSKDDACKDREAKGLLISPSVVETGRQAMVVTSKAFNGLRHQILRVRRIGLKQEDIVRRDDNPSKPDSEPAKTTDSPTSESTTSSTTAKPSSTTPTQSPTVPTTTPAIVTVTIGPTSSSITTPLPTHLNAGSIAATVVFGLVVIASLSFLLFICLRRSKRDYIAKKQRRESSQTQRLLASSGSVSTTSETDSSVWRNDSLAQARDTDSMFVRNSPSLEHIPPLYIPLEQVQRARALSGGLYPLSPESTISSSPMSPSAATIRQSPSPVSPSAAAIRRSSDLSSRYDPASARRSVSYQGQVGRTRVVSIGAARADTLRALSRRPSLVSQLSVDTGVEGRYTRGQ